MYIVSNQRLSSMARMGALAFALSCGVNGASAYEVIVDKSLLDKPLDYNFKASTLACFEGKKYRISLSHPVTLEENNFTFKTEDYTDESKWTITDDEPCVSDGIVWMAYFTGWTTDVYSGMCGAKLGEHIKHDRDFKSLIAAFDELSVTLKPSPHIADHAEPHCEFIGG